MIASNWLIFNWDLFTILIIRLYKIGETFDAQEALRDEELCQWPIYLSLRMEDAIEISSILIIF